MTDSKKLYDRIHHDVYEQVASYRRLEQSALIEGQTQAAERYYHQYMAALSIAYVIEDIGKEVGFNHD